MPQSMFEFVNLVVAQDRNHRFREVVMEKINSVVQSATLVAQTGEMRQGRMEGKVLSGSPPFELLFPKL